MCVSVCVTCTVKQGYVGSEQLVGYFYNAPLIDVAYRLASLEFLTGAAIDTSLCLASPFSFSLQRRG